ncbi:hypothetical protein [Neotabrizicola shimadae]|uniref:Uncharacterized protein n=1 Tax=Neotabrizicola shimadae TaxID=2807096 RepID=A0A8G1EAV3_9RHOB|nr:hypothetical protein [Neotabrizicola shimadae]QYZ68727.1 hypothetical protein JO391_13230 [Neotabrizicola shimadae]
MAVLLVIAAGLAGFIAAVLGWTVFDIGFLAGLGLWSGIGTLGFVLSLAWALMPRRKGPPSLPQPQLA